MGYIREIQLNTPCMGNGKIVSEKKVPEKKPRKKTYPEKIVSKKKSQRKKKFI